MKKKIVFFSIIATIAITMTSCFGSSEEPTFIENDLLGLWQETGTEAYVRFTSEKDDTGEYKFGREWDESEDIFESDLLPYGNGWFKYKLVQSDLTEIHLMDNGGAEIPKVYVVVKLNEYELQYEDERGKMYYYHKYGE